MDKKGFEYLEKQAKAEGFDNVNDYLLYCEMYDTIKKLDAALDRALMPDDLMKYYNELFKDGNTLPTKK